MPLQREAACLLAFKLTHGWGNSARSALAGKGAEARFALLCQCTEGGNMPSRCRHESRVPPTAFSLYSAGRFGSLAELWAKAAGEAVLGAVDFTLGSYLSYAMRARRSASYALISSLD